MNDTVLSTAGAKGLRAALSTDARSVLLLVGAYKRGNVVVGGFPGKELYTLGRSSKALLVHSLSKALEAVNASIAVHAAAEDDEPINSEAMAKLWEIEEIEPERHASPLAARLRRFFKQTWFAWNKPDALSEAAKHNAWLLVAVRTISGGMQVIFEEGILLGDRQNLMTDSNRRFVRDALQKALEMAEIKLAEHDLGVA